MKIKIEKSKLAPALKNVSRAVSPKSPLPVLAGIEFTATEDGKLVLTGTDLEIRICCTVQAEVKEAGSVVLPAATVISLIDRLPLGEVIMEGDNWGVATVKYGKSEAKLNGFPAEEFPEPPTTDAEVKFSIDGESLCDTISRVVYAASDDMTKGSFCGVNFKVEDGNLEMASTDTYRLSLGNLALDGVAQEKTVVIPKKAMEEAVKLFRTPKAVAVEMGKNSITFASERITLTSRIIDGAFPNYKAVLPDSFEAKVKVKPFDLIKSLERVAVLSGSTITLIINQGFIELLSASEKGNAHENIEASVTIARMKICFSAGYLIDAIKNAAIGDSDVWLGFTGPLKPAMVKSAVGGNVLSIVLPVRVREETQLEPVAGQEAQKKAS